MSSGYKVRLSNCRIVVLRPRLVFEFAYFFYNFHAQYYLKYIAYDS